MALIDTFINRVDVYDGDDSQLEITCNAMKQKITKSLGKLSRSPKDRLAHPTGFEPMACRLGGGRSILLSYGC